MNDRQVLSTPTPRIDYEAVSKAIDAEHRRQADTMSPELRDLWNLPVRVEWPDGKRPPRFRDGERLTGF